MSHRWLPTLLLLAACGGGGPGPTVPEDTAITADAAVKQFLQAVADSNITRMGRYWGTSRGPAGVVRQPPDYQQRLVVTQAYLRRSPYRIIGMDRVAEDRMTVTVELDRRDQDGSTCVRKLPIGVLQTDKYGWIVSTIDLNLVGSPGRSCGSGGAGSS